MKHFLGYSILFILMLSACKTTIHNRNSKHFFDYQGHRGARGLMPENTVAGFIKAIDLGVTTLEMDAVVTKDNIIVLSHEPYFHRDITTLPDGKQIEKGKDAQLNIYRMNYADVKKYDVGLRKLDRFPDQQKMPAYKPTLEEVIDSVENYLTKNNLPKVWYNIETKSKEDFDNVYHPGPDKFVDLLLDVVVKKGIADRTILQSFDFRTLQAANKRHPKVQTALLIEKNDKRSLRKQLHDLGFFPTIYSPAMELVNKNLVRELKKDNIKLIPWTINDLAKMKELKKMGVDGIISDYPNLFKELR